MTHRLTKPPTPQNPFVMSPLSRNPFAALQAYQPPPAAKPRTVAVSPDEGCDWVPFPNSGGHLYTRVHAIKFADGSTWDAVNGWRHFSVNPIDGHRISECATPLPENWKKSALAAEGMRLNGELS
jgi:hypothetical protein